MNPLQKRTNPFATQISQPQQKKEVIMPIEEEEEYYEPVKEVVKPKPQPKPQPKPKYDVVEEADRVKYTSTMDRRLRREIKIICAQRGLLFASFIEEACREKLRREGVL